MLYCSGDSLPALLLVPSKYRAESKVLIQTSDLQVASRHRINKPRLFMRDGRSSRKQCLLMGLSRTIQSETRSESRAAGR